MLTCDIDYYNKMYEAAENTSTPAELLIELAKHGSTAIRVRVARNPSAPLQAKIILAKNAPDRVKCMVADDPSIPVELLKTLSKSKAWEVREAVAKTHLHQLKL